MPEPDVEPAQASGPEPDPAPDPDQEPAALGVRQRLRRVRWGHAITVGGAGLAAVAAIGGLWAQAVATYWTQQTALDQLSQSREDSEREEQAQASQVTFWLEDTTPNKAPALHILNRSLDTVTNVVVNIRGFPNGSQTEKLYSGIGFTRDLPPCTETVYNTQSMNLIPAIKPQPKDLFKPGESDFLSVTFSDSHGKVWKRSAMELREWPNPIGTEGLIDMGLGRVKKADNCGDDRS
ncbi:hypothetical protein [Streptomyces sp. NPDC058398]|uniref:hypothetical protein n=1 Tax=Streptomyces sp. NPDC058398 TaxID=3346479 RepID=UPI00364F3016